MSAAEFDPIAPDAVLREMLASPEAFQYAETAVTVVDMPPLDEWLPASVWAVLSGNDTAVRMERLDVLGRYAAANQDGSHIRAEWLRVYPDQVLGGQELICAPERWYAVGRTALLSGLERATLATPDEMMQIMQLVEPKYDRIATERRNPALDELQRQAHQLNLAANARRRGILRWLHNSH